LIEKKQSPVSCSRLIFLLGSVLYNSTGFILDDINFENTDGFKKNDLFVKENKEIFIYLLSFYALDLINNTYLKSEILREYIKSENYLIDKNNISSLDIISAEYLIKEYLDQRYNDGWDISYDINNLPNKDNRLKLNEIQTFSSFETPFLWTPVEKQNPVGGTWGNVKLPFESPEFRHIIMNANNNYDMVDIEADTYKVYIKSLVLTDYEKCVAEFWSGNILSPPLFWMFFMIFYFKNNNESYIDQINKFNILLTSLFVSSIITWKLKYTIYQNRPIQTIRCINDLNINYYYGNTISNLWKPYIDTPPFPDFPSGHSTFSCSSCVIFNYLFGNNINEKEILIDSKNMKLISNLFNDSSIENYDIKNIIIKKGTSLKTEEILKDDIILKFDTWKDMAFNCSESRFYGGIHYTSSCECAIIIGDQIGNLILEKYKYMLNKDYDL
jgi:hypothetical protein